MGRSILFSLAVLVLSHSVYAQTKGSAAANAIIARAVREQQLREYNRKMRWEKAKKLGLFKTAPTEVPTDFDRCTEVGKLQADSIAYLDYWDMKIIQIAGETDMLIALNSPRRETLWLQNYPTKGLVDNDPIRLIGLVRVVGTKSYTNTLKARKTVRVIEFIPKKEQEEHEQKRTEGAWKLRWSKEHRTWKDITGKFELDAVLDGFEGNGVRLLKKDRSKVVVPLSKLSNNDRRRAIDIRSKQAKKNQARRPGR